MPTGPHLLRIQTAGDAGYQPPMRFRAAIRKLVVHGARPAEVAQTLLATMVVLFAGTTMDSGVRLQRYIIQEWGEIYGIDILKKGMLATVVAVAACLLLAFGAGGASGTGGLIIWPLFNSTNQILAGLTLLVIGWTRGYCAVHPPSTGSATPVT